MCVDHGRTDVGMSEQFLDRTDIMAIFQQVRGEAVAQAVATGMFVDRSALHGCGHGLLHGVFVHVVSLPCKLASCLWVFFGQRVGQPGPAGTVTQILLVDLADVDKLFLESVFQALRQRHAPIFLAFAIVHGDLVPFEVDVFDAESAFHQCRSGSG